MHRRGQNLDKTLNEFLEENREKWESSHPEEAIKEREEAIKERCRPIWENLSVEERLLFHDDLKDFAGVVRNSHGRDMPSSEAIMNTVSEALVEKEKKEQQRKLLATTCRQLVDESTIERDFYISFDELVLQVEYVGTYNDNIPVDQRVSNFITIRKAVISVCENRWNHASAEEKEWFDDDLSYFIEAISESVVESDWVREIVWEDEDLSINEDVRNTISEVLVWREEYKAREQQDKLLVTLATTPDIFVYINEETRGPVNIDQLHSLDDAGLLSPTDLACKEGMETWGTVESFLFDDIGLEAFFHLPGEDSVWEQQRKLLVTTPDIFVYINEETRGPVNIVQLQSWVDAGLLSPTDLTCREGMESWITVEHLLNQNSR